MLSASQLAGATDGVLRGHSALGSEPKRHHRAFSSKAWAQLGSRQAAAVSLKSPVHELVFPGARHSHAGPLGVFFPSSCDCGVRADKERLRNLQHTGAWTQLGSKQAAAVSLKTPVHELVFLGARHSHAG